MNASKVNHLILLTDGHTYGDEEKCIKLARQAAEMGVRISCLGVGTEWNDNFLDQLAVLTGGSSMFISLAQDIQTAMFEKFSQLGKIYADESKLEYKKSDGIDIRYAFRVQPEANLLKTDNPIFLGPVFTNNTLKILLEFFITPEIIKNQTLLNFFNGQFSTSILGSSISFETFPIVLSLPIANEHPIIPPREILDALSQIRFYRLQDQARQEINDGSYDQAADHLTMLATHLLSQGKKNLAKTVLIEVENIQNKKTLSKQGSKEIKYGTKALLGIGKQEG